jgi:hypothetical protein
MSLGQSLTFLFREVDRLRARQCAAFFGTSCSCCATINAFKASGFSVSRSGRVARCIIVRAVCQKLVHRYALRSRYDRLRDRGMLTAAEAAARLHIHEATVIRWAEYGLITRHAYNARAYPYEVPNSNLPAKHSSRWHPLVERAAALKTNAPAASSPAQHSSYPAASGDTAGAS